MQRFGQVQAQLMVSPAYHLMPNGDLLLATEFKGFRRVPPGGFPWVGKSRRRFTGRARPVSPSGGRRLVNVRAQYREVTRTRTLCAGHFSTFYSDAVACVAVSRTA
jgi:hypothetical protein